MKTPILYSLLLTMCAVAVVAAPIDVGLEASADYYALIDPTTFYSTARARMTLVPDISYRSDSRRFEAGASALLYLQAFGEPPFVDPARLIREAYLGLHIGLFDVFVGQRFVRWGMVDLMSPLNVVNHSDTTVLSADDPYEATLADPMVQVQFFPSDLWYIDAVYVPFLQPDDVGMEETVIQEQLRLDLPGGTSRVFDVDASFLDRPVHPFSRWAHSFHLSAHLTSFWIDLTGMYSFFTDQSPDFDLSGVQETIDVEGSVTTHEITGTAYPAYNRVHTFGLGASFYLRDLLVSADSALKLSQDRDGTRMEVKNSEINSVVQVERLFWQNRLRGQVNLLHRYLLKADATTVSVYSPVVHAYINEIVAEYLLQKPASQLYVMLGADAKFLRERLSVAAVAVYGIEEEILFAMPRISLKLSDYLSLQLGADLTIGPEGTGLLGGRRDDDNVYLRARMEI